MKDFTNNENKPLYKVVDKKDIPLLIIHDNKPNRALEIIPYERMLRESKKNYQLTEQQIKNYDERYMAFAVEVSEEDYE